ncbi:hypothetical protein Patl1_15176 [Pistacia atlantica]|uniref:Uncharacterized protein n=1 Tax=Pistacia atlantica TaxID=434234 RepID=A0ACC1B867_9ROSI|nr:hypothetical protein Patl1_15176 [Pistacia atlantica]
MRREGSLLTFSNFLVSVLIFLFITEIQARKLQQECSSSCGDINNIRYPFRLKGDPAVCGHSDFELSRQSNKTILEFHSGKYYVKGISHKENTISVVDVNLASGTCRLPYGSTVMPHFSGYQHQFCSLNAVTPIYYRPYELFGNNTNHYETIRKSLQSGFNLTWYLECRDCLAPVVYAGGGFAKSFHGLVCEYRIPPWTASARYKSQAAINSCLYCTDYD